MPFSNFSRISSGQNTAPARDLQRYALGRNVPPVDSVGPLGLDVKAIGNVRECGDLGTYSAQSLGSVDHDTIAGEKHA